MTTFETLAFYRGVSSKYPTDRPSILTPRRDRKPKNSSEAFHTASDAWFDMRFGIRYRSQGLFLTSNINSAANHAATSAHIMRVVPLSSYRYCWSRTISDLLYTATQLESPSKEQIEKHLHEANYLESDLEGAHKLGNEVMLYCDRYMAIPIGQLGIAQSQVERTIILPS